jgi:hypothetical protein
MIRSAVLDKVGYFDETLVHPIDYDLWLKASLHFRFDYIDEVLTRYRVHANMTKTLPYMSKRPDIDRVTYRFLDEYGGRKVVPPNVIRLAESVRCCNIAGSYLDEQPLDAMSWYFEALRHSPMHLPGWYGLIRSVVPTAIRRVLSKTRSPI